MPYALVLVLLLAGCGSTSTPEAQAPGDDLAELRRQIDVEIGEAEAGSVAACRVMPLGHKPCGGPAGYVAYSTEASDEGRLRALAERYTDLQRAWNEERGMMSDCAITPEPEPALEGGRCVARLP